MRQDGGSRQSRRREASVVFADISGFTAMSEKLDPEAVTDTMNRCFAVLEDVVLARGGAIDKYLGDCVVSVFGLGSGDDRAPEEAVVAALGMRQALDGFNRETPLPEPLGLHIGIATGNVIVGEIGGEARRQFTITGDAVNLASRLEDLSARGQILVGPKTLEKTSSEFEYRALPATEGRDTPVAVYELVTTTAERPERRTASDPLLEATELATERRGTKRPSERRQATVVFAEIIGFRALSESMEAEAMTGLLNRCFAMLASSVVERGGVVDKYIGECVMALFGVPNAIEDAPNQAINAAIEMRNRLADFSRDEELPAALHLHIGINTGLVIAGEVGGRVKREFTVMGDTVNLAARLKEAASESQICIGPETRRYLREAFGVRPLPPLSLKGKAQPVRAFELLSEKEQLHRARVDLEQVSSAMVGRAEELARLRESVLRMLEGYGGSVALVGDAGIGKSRLVAELLAQDAARSTLVLEGRSVSAGQNLSYHPFVDLLRQWAGITDDDSDQEEIVHLEQAVLEVAPNEAPEIVPFVAALMGMRLSGPHAERLHGVEGEALEKLIAKAVRELLQIMAARRPIILVFDDLHWADQSSIGLLGSLLRVAVAERVLFVFVSYPDFPSTSGLVVELAREELGVRHVDVRLRPLDDEQTTQLVQNLLSIDNLPYSIRVQIARKAEGNPFYIQEVVRGMVEARAIEQVEGRFRATEKIESFIIPSTVQEVIMARVDRLDPQTRHVVQVASVIGRSFFYSIIAEIVHREGMLSEHVFAQLEDLKKRQLLIERKAGWTVKIGATTVVEELEYIFQHSLAQQTIYESILHRTRKEFHQMVAAGIESLFADRLSDFYGMLAYHYGRAENAEKAEEFVLKAGEEAVRSAASSEALEFFREASRLYFQLYGDEGDPIKKAVLEKHLGTVLLNKGNLTESIEHFDHSLEYFGERLPKRPFTVQAQFLIDFTIVMLQLYLKVGRVAPRRGSPHDEEIFQVIFNRARALTTSDPARYVVANIHGLRRLGRVDARRIDQACGMYAGVAALFAYSGLSFRVSQRFLDRARPLIRPGNVRDAFVYRSMQFVQHYLSGNWSRESDLEPESITEALRFGLFWDVDAYLGLLCDRFLRQGDFRAAEECLVQLDGLLESYGYEFARSNRDGMRTVLLLEQRRLQAALQAAELYSNARHEATLRLLGLGLQAKIRTLRGERDQTEGLLARASQVIRQAGRLPAWHVGPFASARLRQDLLLLEDEGSYPARALVRRARKSASFLLKTASVLPSYRTEAYSLAGRLFWQLARRRRARGMWERGLAEGERLGAWPEVGRTHLEIARCVLEWGKRGANTSVAKRTPESHLERAREIFKQNRLEWDLREWRAVASHHGLEGLASGAD